MGISKSDGGDKDVWLNTFLNVYLIMNAEKIYLLKTDDMYQSGFPELASIIGRKEFVVHNF